MKLWIQDRERRRAFRLGEGSLSVGSAPEARLRLSSPGVAPLHARIEVDAAGVRLVREPGTQAPEVDGQPLAAESVALAPGRRVRIGEALLWLEHEPGDRAPGDPAPAARSAPAPRTAPAARPRGPVQRRARQRRRGLPGWAVSALAVSAVGVVLLLVWRAFLFSAAQAAPEAEARLAVARSLFEEGELEAAEARLALLEGEAEGLDGAQRAALEALRGEIAAVRRESELARRNREGAKLFDWLQQYEKDSLAGTPDPPRVRLFLQRARLFREQFPEHPGLAWLARQESRFEGLVDLDAPPSWRDVRWEARALTRGVPRDYAAAFAVVDRYLARGAGEPAERDEAERYRRLLVEERQDYYRERMLEARERFQEGQAGKAVAGLVNQVILSGDAELSDQAAQILIQMPDAFRHLQGYREYEPEQFERLMENAIVATYFRAKELGN